MSYYRVINIIRCFQEFLTKNNKNLLNIGVVLPQEKKVIYLFGCLFMCIYERQEILTVLRVKN